MKKGPNWVCVKDKYARRSRRSDKPHCCLDGKCPVCGGELVFLFDYEITPKSSTADWKRVALLLQGRIDEKKRKDDKATRMYFATRPRQLKIMEIVEEKRYKKTLDKKR